jgi:hypothetical protein
LSQVDKHAYELVRAVIGVRKVAALTDCQTRPPSAGHLRI